MREGYGEQFPEIRAALGLVKAPRQESYGGFVFASLAAEGIPLADHLGHARGAIDRLLALSPSGQLQLSAGWMKHRMFCNWKMVMENNVDGYHALFTHQSVYDAVRPAKVSHVPSKTETLVRDMGDGHSEIDYATEYRRLDEEFVWFGRLKREKVPGYIEALESAHGAAVAHDALVIGPPHTLIYRFDVLRRQERPHLAFGFGPHVCLAPTWPGWRRACYPTSCCERSLTSR